MLKRSDHMKDGSKLHRKYYSQFVNDEVKRVVLTFFDKETLEKSYAKDKYFNTKLTPIERWDLMGGFKFSRTTGEMLIRPYMTEPIDSKLLKEADEGYSSATAVCIYKEAARQIIGIKI